MSVTMKLNFPAGRYHATPWGKHVNEGAAEWPPSPWRLLRALVAVWKRTCPEVEEAQIKRILTALVRPPLFHLPPHRVAHTRHYMPWEKKGPADRTLVFDTFVSVHRKSPLLIHWPDAILANDDRQVLAKLVGNLTFLGRAEGWVHAELTDVTALWNCVPGEDTSDPVPVFCADPSSVFADDHYPTLDPKKLAKGKINPADFLFDSPRWHLCLDTQTMHAERWPRVPGARWVPYVRPGIETPHDPREQKPTMSARPITLARFVLDGPVLPLVRETLPFAEQARHTVLGIYKKVWNTQHNITDNAPVPLPPLLTGKDPQALPLRHDHQHAFFLPTDEDADGHLDHLTLWLPAGLPEPPDERSAILTAIDRFRFLRFGSFETDLRLMLVALGTPSQFHLPWMPAQQRDLSRVWASATPYVATKYPKLRGQKRDPEAFLASATDFAGHNLASELSRQIVQSKVVSVSSVAELVQVDGEQASQALPAWQFKRGRQKRGDDGDRRSFGAFRIEFADAITGPLCLGYGCHFGLGLFVPIRDEKSS